MLFDIERDTGDRLVGYFVPDSYTDVPIIRVTSGLDILLTLEANEPRPSVVAAGRHGNGMCGFSLTTEHIPQLDRYDRLEIEDASSGFVFYRRRPSNVCTDFKLFRLELCHSRDKKLDSILNSRFQLSFSSVDQLGRETCTQSFLLKSTKSLYVSARILYKEFEYSIDDSFKKVLLAQDPYVELAEMLLRMQDNSQPLTLDLREQFGLAECRSHFSDVELTDSKEVRRALRQIPQTLEAVLANPFARLLASRNVDETQNLSFIPNALRTLASFDIIGIRERLDSFVAPLTELLNLPPNQLPLDPPSPHAISLGEILSQVPLVTSLLEMDLEIYDQICTAYKSSHD
jgi:hypothetical protein